MAEKLTARRVGGVRPSQVMYTYGVGAPIDLPHYAVVVAGLDDWDEADQTVIREERLLGAVRLDPNGGPQVDELRGPPWLPDTRNPFEKWAFTGIPVIPFPRWMRCSACNLLTSIDSGLLELEVPVSRPHESRYLHKCNTKGKAPAAVPARFVIACPSGHLDEFPWVEFCHKGQPCTGAAILEAFDVGDGHRSTNLGVRCRTCGATAYVSQAFGQSAANILPKCRGRMPHLRRFDKGCDNQSVAMLLGASNAWFPVTRSVLSIPAGANPLEQTVAEHFGALDKADTIEKLGLLIDVADQLKPLRDYPLDDVWAVVEARRGGGNEPADVDLLRPEWEVLNDPIGAPAGPDFQLRAVAAPTGFGATVAPTVLAERLREVVALTGFTRVDGPDSGVAGDPAGGRTVALSGRRPTWLPASEIRGEGLFLRLPEDVVAGWEERVAGTPRLEALRLAHQRWRQRRGLDPAANWRGERYVLLHSLSHALINEFALECGYAAASIRERIYCRAPGEPGGPMAGILLYTAAPDTEGTLGGLVALGEPDTLGRMLTDALERAALCSTDPMCADHVPEEDSDTLHSASCHACLFVPETSCESGNRYLDRAVLVQTFAAAGVEYFTLP
jgi:hypothetical protein